MSQNETKKKKPRTHPLYAVVLFLIKIVYTIIYRPHVHGKENIPDKNKAYIVCSNHISGNDVIFMAWSLGQQAHFVAKEELMKKSNRKEHILVCLSSAPSNARIIS